jgi:hypothetical protein
MKPYRCAAFRPFLFCTAYPRSYTLQDAASTGSLRILPVLLKMTIPFNVALGQGLQRFQTIARVVHEVCAHFKASGERLGGAELTVTAFTDRLLPPLLVESFFSCSERDQAQRAHGPPAAAVVHSARRSSLADGKRQLSCCLHRRRLRTAHPFFSFGLSCIREPALKWLDCT